MPQDKQQETKIHGSEFHIFQQPSWIEELKREFPDIFNLPEGGMSVWLEESYTNQMIDFIQTLLSQRDNEVIERAKTILEKEKEIYGTDKHGLSFEQLVNIIKLRK